MSYLRTVVFIVSTSITVLIYFIVMVSVFWNNLNNLKIK